MGALHNITHSEKEGRERCARVHIPPKKSAEPSVNTPILAGVTAAAHKHTNARGTDRFLECFFPSRWETGPRREGSARRMDAEGDD